MQSRKGATHIPQVWGWSYYQIERVYLGKRRSAGNGAAQVEWKHIARSPLWPCLPPKGNTVLVQLMSDAILPSPNGGFYRTWEQEHVKPIASFFQEYPGWSMLWELPRESALVVCAGSVFQVQRDAPVLMNLSAEGIGIRRNEGFGWVAIDPPWLQEELLSVSPANEEDTENTILDWPGISDTERDPDEVRERLRGLNRSAREIVSRLNKQQQQQFTVVSAYAKRVESVCDVHNFLNKMADRANTHNWDITKNALSATLTQNCSSIDEARFFLDAAVTYVTED